MDVSAEWPQQQIKTTASRRNSMKLSFLGVGLLTLTSTLGLAQAAPQQAPALKQDPAVTLNQPQFIHRGADIHQRRAFQHKRIVQGVRTGALRPAQAQRLMKREASIGRQQRHMRFAHNGRLTRFDRVRLNHRLNRTSRAIYRARHAGRRDRFAAGRKQ
jgi:hypothetical protein